jgi:hypothetical protein
MARSSSKPIRQVPAKSDLEKRPPMPPSPSTSQPHKGQPNNAREWGEKQEPAPAPGRGTAREHP